MATELTKFERTKKSFPRNTRVKFTAGRGHTYVGTVKDVAYDSYLLVGFTNTHGDKVLRRISAKNAVKTRAQAS